MKTEVKLITPVIAEELLKRNTMNRMPKTSIINEYAREMASGLWREETGEAIKIAFDGTILDGQQRLMAIIRANVSLSFLIITDLDKDVFKVLDSGTKRTGGDVFYTAGIDNARSMAAAIIRYLALKSGSIKLANATRFKASSSELLSIYYSRAEFWESVMTMGRRWYSESGRILTMSELMGLYAYFYDIDKDDCFSFMDKLATGVGLDINDPIRQLREKLIFAKINPRFNIPNFYRTGMVFKAWNFFRDKKTVKFLKFTDQEIYPIPK